MKNPYDENGLPRNIVCGGLSNSVVFCTFINLPDVKYFDDETWEFYYVPYAEEKMWSAKVSLGHAMQRIEYSSYGYPFYEYPEEFQEFIMRFYVDTFGRPEDWRGDTFVG